MEINQPASPQGGGGGLEDLLFEIGCLSVLRIESNPAARQTFPNLAPSLTTATDSFLLLEGKETLPLASFVGDQLPERSHPRGGVRPRVLMGRHYHERFVVSNRVLHRLFLIHYTLSIIYHYPKL